ncbi:hypothetical protein [Methylobacterium radiodurans]|uniref:hypothetical protein n=1 Tax=Methylobacterium radiodurans TaxID=2202828 RepID=UPI0013A55C78|nr:hypothetical protein [Methylobacterium radiodurans]
MPALPEGKGGHRSRAETHAVRRVGQVVEGIMMSDGIKPDDLPAADEGAGLPTPPSPGLPPPPHLPPPPDRSDPPSDAEETADAE